MAEHIGGLVRSDLSARPSHQGGYLAADKDRYQWPWTGYSEHPREMPLAGYSVLLGAYVVTFGSLFALLWPRRGGSGERAGAGDAVLFGVATHKIGRILTKDWVTSPLRAPFTEYAGSTGGGEVDERSRGDGLQRAVGDLLTCPWCIAPWVAGGLYSTFLISPRAARLLATVFASVAVSDSLQHGYGALKVYGALKAASKR